MDDGECGTPITIEGDVEHAEDIMDLCIEVESNERMRNENIDRWTLRFKQPEMETKVSACTSPKMNNTRSLHILSFHVTESGAPGMFYTFFLITFKIVWN